ncbi:hypothetical protein ACLQ3C_06545 [Gordonia sp. DT30]|uniref:hypothetical protein n=1 Tax=Gordonia sp. DT30 TaxID=3416546 RepID=UPI003CEF919A
MTTPRLLPILYGVGAVLAAVILAPLYGGHLLYRDAVSTPRSFVTDAALGIGPLAPRAAPQDWFVAVTSTVVDGGIVVAVVLTAALACAAVGYGRLAARLVPGAGRTGAVAAAVVSVWNPFVAERLLQGHWGLLVGFAALGWIVVAAADLVAQPLSLVRWLQLGALLAAAGLTPTGSVLALVTGVVAVAASETGHRLRLSAAVVALWVCSALPWLVAAAIGGGSAGSDGRAGVAAFGLRPEPGLGSWGTALGLGGIWNSDAVPASRTIWWAAVATLCLLLVVVAGSVTLWRSRIDSHRRPLIRASAALAVVAVVVVAATASGPGRSALGMLVDAVPSAGLVRDTQKFLALTMPFIAVATAGAVMALRRHVPSGFALAAVALLVVAPLPDLGWGVGGRITPVHYPADWARVAAIVPADSGAVALWPPGTVRDYTFADGVSLDPAPRMLRAPVIESGELRVDGVVVDRAEPGAAEVDRALHDGADPATLAALGVGWVLVERDVRGGADLPARPAGLTPVFAGADLELLRVEGPAAAGATAAARVSAWTAHLVWAALIVAGGLAAGTAAARRGLIGATRRRAR